MLSESQVNIRQGRYAALLERDTRSLNKSMQSGTAIQALGQNAKERAALLE